MWFSEIFSLQELLTSSPDAQPVIFFRSVTFSELESLVTFIYSGKASVPGPSVQAFLALCHSLGVR